MLGRDVATSNPVRTFPIRTSAGPHPAGRHHRRRDRPPVRQRPRPDAATIAGTRSARALATTARASATAAGREEVVQRCDVRYEQEYEERIEGYRVTYEYNGREYTTRLPYDPGERIRVRVAVAPAE